ncbi:hypothetical protein LINGRAHAP2_LOCUS12574 [Linum grandiflorum]
MRRVEYQEDKSKSYSFNGGESRRCESRSTDDP